MAAEACYSPASEVQVLVRLDNAKTYVVAFPFQAAPLTDSDILDKLSLSSRVPVRHLRIVQYSALATATVQYATARTAVSILGGKGGFGTLLKGQSKQAGARTTLDFGACRDLSGRRLRHVNDEIKLRKWREAQRKRAAGIPVDELEQLRTASGIRNWHLMVPHWSLQDPSAKGKRRQDNNLKLEVDKWLTLEHRQRTRHLEAQKLNERIVEDYVKAGADQENEDGGTLSSAILEGMRKRQRLNKELTAGRDIKGAACHGIAEAPNALDDVVQSQKSLPRTSFLCTLSGNVVTEDDGMGGKLSASRTKIQSKSEFATACILLTPSQSPDSVPKGLYYEITIQTGGLAQIGWANMYSLPSKTDVGMYGFRPNTDTGDGVGDDLFSYGFDGSRSLIFHNGKEALYDLKSHEPITPTWKPGDVIGCIYDLSNGHISYSKNGVDMGTAFCVPTNESVNGKKDDNDASTFPLLFPAFSLNENEILGINTGPSFEYFPGDGNVGVCMFVDQDVAEQGGDEGMITRNVKDENDDERKPAAATVVPANVDEKAAFQNIDSVPTGPLDTAPDTFTSHPISEQPTTMPEILNDSLDTTAPSERIEVDSKKPVDLEEYATVEALEQLGLDRLKHALMALGCKCGGSLRERATRLFSLKGLSKSEYPLKVRAKNFSLSDSMI